MVRPRSSFGRISIRLPVNIPHCTFASGKIRSRHKVISALMDYKPAACNRIGIVIIMLIEPVPPVKMVFGQIGLTVLAVMPPFACHKQTAFSRSHGPVRPACAAELVFYRSHIIFGIRDPQIKTVGRHRYPAHGIF